jgi:hypothetical protein
VIPSLAEQHRIVAKVDALMARCDQLEAQLTTTQTDSRRLLEAVLETALAPASGLRDRLYSCRLYKSSASSQLKPVNTAWL